MYCTVIFTLSQLSGLREKYSTLVILLYEKWSVFSFRRSSHMQSRTCFPAMSLLSSYSDLVRDVRLAVSDDHWPETLSGEQHSFLLYITVTIVDRLAALIW